MKLISKVKKFSEFILEKKVYKGTNPDAINYTYNGSDDGIGEFYTDNLTMAKWFAGLVEYDCDKEKYVSIKKSNGTVNTHDISLKNPFIVDSDDEDNDSFQEYMGMIDDCGGVEEFRNELLSNNHDGIILKNCNTNYYKDGTYNIIIKF